MVAHIKNGRLMITVDEAVRIAREWMRSSRVMDPGELSDKLDVMLEGGHYKIKTEGGLDVVYICSYTGAVLYPNSDIRYDPHLR